MRLGRRGWWLASITLWGVYAVLRATLDAHDMPLEVAAACLMVGAVLLLAAARLRDRARSPWWLLAVLVPVVGTLWLGWQLWVGGSRASAEER